MVTYTKIVKKNQLWCHTVRDKGIPTSAKRTSLKGAITKTIQKLEHLENVEYKKRLEEIDKITMIQSEKEYELIGLLVCIK